MGRRELLPRLPLPEWLADALDKFFYDQLIIDKEKQKREWNRNSARVVHAVRDAIHGDRRYPVFYQVPGEKAENKHFRIACDRLNAEGWHYSLDYVEKQWRRHYAHHVPFRLEK